MKKLIFIFTTMLLVANLGFSQTIIYESPERPSSSVSLEDDGWDFYSENSGSYYTFSTLVYGDYLQIGAVTDPSPTALFMTRDFSNETVGLSTYNGFEVELELQGANHSTDIPNLEVYLDVYIVNNSTSDTIQRGSETVTVAGFDETPTFHTISLNGITLNDVSIVISIDDNVSHNGYTLHNLKIAGSETSSVTEANIQDDFKIYQSNGMLNVQSEIESNYTIQIFNTSGQLVSTNNSSNRNTQVYVDELQTGFYIINLEDGVSRFSKKLFIKN